MLTDASKEAGKDVKVKDVVEIIAERLVVAEQAIVSYGCCSAAIGQLTPSIRRMKRIGYLAFCLA